MSTFSKKVSPQVRIASGALLFFFISTFVFGPLVLPTPAFAVVSDADWQKGVSIIPQNTTDISSPGFAQVVQHLKSLGVNYVSIIIPQYQSNINSSDIGPGWNTPTDDALKSAVATVHAAGMKVMFKIHIEPYDGNWRANIRPTDRTTWYKKYGDMLAHYAVIAQQTGVESYCLGVELIGTASGNAQSDNAKQWRTMITRVRQSYTGMVFYDANWGGDEWNIAFWDALDALGISAYYDMGSDGSVSALKVKWDSINKGEIQPLYNAYKKPILFSEVGYRSVTNAHVHPWDPWSPSGPYNGQEQVNAYEALFSYWNDYSYMKGVQIWYGTPDPNAGGAGDTNYFIANKPVEETLKKWFLGTSAPPPASPPTFSVSGSASPQTLSTGQSTALSVSVHNTGGATTGVVVDLEVYQGGTLVFQKFCDGQNFGSGGTNTYSSNWTPGQSDSYTVKVGVFSNAWASLYIWNNQVTDIAVSASGGGGPQSSTVEMWWPGDGASVHGVQPWKGVLADAALSSYTLYWQVGNGQLNQMQDSFDGYPHKEAWADLTGWNWDGQGPYTITFVAKNSAGTTLGTKSAVIYVR